MSWRKAKISDIIKLFRGKKSPPKKPSPKKDRLDLLEEQTQEQAQKPLTAEERKLQEKLRLQEPSEEDLEQDLIDYLKGKWDE